MNTNEKTAELRQRIEDALFRHGIDGRKRQGEIADAVLAELGLAQAAEPSGYVHCETLQDRRRKAAEIERASIDRVNARERAVRAMLAFAPQPQPQPQPQADPDTAALAKRLDKVLGCHADSMPKEAYFEVDAVMRALNAQAGVVEVLEDALARYDVARGVNQHFDAAAGLAIAARAALAAVKERGNG